MQDLAREVPVVERLGGVDALVALQPDQRQLEALRDRLGERGLAGAGLTLEQQRPLHLQREERHRRQRVVGEVAGPAEAGGDGGGRREAPCRQGYSGRWQVGRRRRRAGGEIAALDELGVVVGEVGPRTRGRPSVSATTAAQWSRPMTTGWPGRPSYVARRSVPGPGGGSRSRRTTSAPTSGRSTRVTTHGVGVGAGQRRSGRPAATRTCRPPSRRRRRRSRRCPRAAAAPPRRRRRARRSPGSQPPSARARTPRTSQLAHADALGIPIRDPAPAASSSPCDGQPGNACS